MQADLKHYFPIDDHEAKVSKSIAGTGFKTDKTALHGIMQQGKSREVEVSLQDPTAAAILQAVSPSLLYRRKFEDAFIGFFYRLMKL
jgi:hypothetical protein